MLDPKKVRQEPELVKAGVRKKGDNPEIVDQFLLCDGERLELLQITEAMQAKLNHGSSQLATASPEAKEQMREELRELSEKTKQHQAKLTVLEEEWQVLLRQIPNLPAEEVPDGNSDHDNQVIRTEGVRPEFSFTPQDHETLALNLGLLDLERGAKVAGTKFYYLKNELALLEQAVLRFVLDQVRAQNFTLLTVPHLAKAQSFYGAGHFVTNEDAENGDAYRVERDQLYLAGTAEVGLVSYRANELLAAQELPLHYVALSPCYRREAGAAGKETKGLFRVHQFQKVEMVSLVRPEESEAEHARLLSISESILQKLGLHYQVVLNCGGDLGHPQVKKWDLETWLPGMNKFGETHSCSNDTDFQARSLNIRYRTQAGNEFVHTLNNTAIASPRILVALLENYQEEDGSIRIPEVLHSYTGFQVIQRA